MKVRHFPEHNYRAIFHNGSTLRIAIDPNKPISKLDYPEIIDISLGSKCESGKCHYCFARGSLIETKTGKKEIQNIKKGETVVTFNNGTTLNKVEQLHRRRYTGKMICIRLENGKVIKCTPNHKIFTQNRGWIEAKEIQTNDNLLHV